MKKISVSLDYDEEKLAALKLYLEQKNISLESRISEQLEALYQKNVPLTVRQFIDFKSGNLKGGSQNKPGKGLKPSDSQQKSPQPQTEQNTPDFAQNTGDEK